MAQKILLVTDRHGFLQWHEMMCVALRAVAEVTVAGVPAPSRPWTSRLLPDLRPSGRTPMVLADALWGGRRSGFDAIIDLTSGRSVPAQPGQPVLSLITADGRPLLQNLPFLEEAYRPGGTATVLLVERRRGVPDVILDRFTLATARRSYAAFLRALLRHAATALAARLQRPGAEEPRRPPAPSSPGSPPAPGFLSLLRFLGRGALDHLWHQNKDKLLMEDWRIGYLPRPITTVVRTPIVADARWLDAAGPDEYLADPFALPGAADRLYCEVYSWSTGRGDIRELAIAGRSGTLTRPKNFDCETHMSFPFLFEEDGELYCIPERLGEGSITIFRFDRARDRWERFATPQAGVRAADPALFKANGLYWIAFTDVDIDAYDNLCLVHAEALAGPWTRHARHPVKVDVRSSRSAGTPFVSGGALFRPAQDCSGTYGGAIAVNRVTDCTPTSFAEEVVAVLRPDRLSPAPHGVHTLSAWGERTLIDGKRYRFSPGILARKLSRKITALLAAQAEAAAGRAGRLGGGGNP